MKKIILNNKGQLILRDKDYFGGKYSFIERLKMNGIGSIKVFYQSGIPYFDEVESIENETSFVNFELMKNGFLIRLNRNQQLRYIGFQLHEILNIKLEKDHPESVLKISTLNDDLLLFKIPTRDIDSLAAFFKKVIFKEKFEYIRKY